MITDEGMRLAPNAVFGLAFSRALDREILPKHFSAGEDSVCFRLLREAGYRIVSKGETLPAVAEADSDPDETPLEAYPEGAKVKAARRPRAKACGGSGEEGRLYQTARPLVLRGVLRIPANVTGRSGDHDRVARYGTA